LRTTFLVMLSQKPWTALKRIRLATALMVLSQSNIPKAPPVKLFNYKTHTTESLAFTPSTALQCLRSNNDAIQTAE
jgi:hypothetical protein